MRWFKYITIVFIVNFILFGNAFAQTKKITATIVDGNTNIPLYYALVIKKKTSTGVATNLSGVFEIEADAKDTLLITSFGYKLKRIAISNILSTSDNIKIYPLTYTLNAVSIIPDYTLNEVAKRLDNIRTPMQDKYNQSRSEAFTSPITFLYRSFNRLEKSKRMVEQLTNDDNRLFLRRSLFKVYMFEDYVKVDAKQLDNFIGYCNISDDYIISNSEYDLAVLIKKKFSEYTNQNDYVRPQ